MLAIDKFWGGKIHVLGRFGRDWYRGFGAAGWGMAGMCSGVVHGHILARVFVPINVRRPLIPPPDGG